MLIEHQGNNSVATFILPFLRLFLLLTIRHFTFLKKLITFYLLVGNGRVHSMCVEVEGQRSGVFSFYHVDPGDPTHGLGLGGRCLYLLSLLTSLWSRCYPPRPLAHGLEWSFPT